MSFLWNVVTASVVGRKKTCDREAFLVSCRRVKISATNSIFKFALMQCWVTCDTFKFTRFLLGCLWQCSHKMSWVFFQKMEKLCNSPNMD